jgi:hypothetical protein
MTRVRDEIKRDTRQRGEVRGDRGWDGERQERERLGDVER